MYAVVNVLEHVYVHLYAPIYMGVCVYAHVHVYGSVNACVRVHVYVHVHIQNALGAQLCVGAHACVCRYVYTWLRTCIYQLQAQPWLFDAVIFELRYLGKFFLRAATKRLVRFACVLHAQDLPKISKFTNDNIEKVQVASERSR